MCGQEGYQAAATRKKEEEKKDTLMAQGKRGALGPGGVLLSLLMKLEKKSVDAFNVGEEYWFSMRSEGSGSLGRLRGEGGEARGER